MKSLTSRNSLSEVQIKITLVGDKFVGKTNFLMRYLNLKKIKKQIYLNSYCANSNFTPHDRTKSIFNNFNTHVKYEDKIVKLDFWELPSSEEYFRMRQISYPQTDAFFILYAINDPNSLHNALNIVLFFKKNLKRFISTVVS